MRGMANGLKHRDLRPLLGMVVIPANDAPFAPGDWANVLHVLFVWVVEPDAMPRIPGAYEGVPDIDVTGALIVLERHGSKDLERERQQGHADDADRDFQHAHALAEAAGFLP